MRCHEFAGSRRVHPVIIIRSEVDRRERTAFELAGVVQVGREQFCERVIDALGLQQPVAAQMKLEDVLKKRYVMFETDGTLMLIPFENVKYIQVYPAPEKVPGHTYIKEATVV